MVRAREALLARGGASRSNVFTRLLLVLFGIMSWNSVPIMPVEIMLLPRWFPFHLNKISYWGAHGPGAAPRHPGAQAARQEPTQYHDLDELFLERPLEIGPPQRAPHQNAGWFTFFRGIDAILRRAEPKFPRQRAAVRLRARSRS